MARLRSGATFVDAGCFFGQEIRFLVFNERIPASQLYAFDLEPAFIDMGYELVRDKETLHAHFFLGDLLATNHSSTDEAQEQKMRIIEGKMDIVHAASVLHSWG